MLSEVNNASLHNHCAACSRMYVQSEPGLSVGFHLDVGGSQYFGDDREDKLFNDSILLISNVHSE